MRMYADDNNEFYPESGGDIYWGAIDPDDRQTELDAADFFLRRQDQRLQLPRQCAVAANAQGPFNYFNGCNAAYVAPHVCRGQRHGNHVIRRRTSWAATRREPRATARACSLIRWMRTRMIIRRIASAARRLAITEYWQIHSRGQNIMFADGHSKWYKAFNPGEMTFGYNSMTNWIQYP